MKRHMEITALGRRLWLGKPELLEASAAWLRFAQVAGDRVSQLQGECTELLAAGSLAVDLTHCCRNFQAETS
jgi:hypothetical protein